MEQTAIQIVQTLQNKGFEAYFAGGCVRDILQNRDPDDYDIVTSAKPDEIEDILEKTLPIGKSFGVIVTLVNGHQFEIATFRSDSGSSDGRRPDYVTFTSAKEDAKRRDFSINGLFFDPIAKKTYDYIDGKKDLNEKIIRFIGESETRIQEDHLRIIRAVRFRNKLDFQYHPETYNALKKYAHLIKKVSKERIRDELNKIIVLKNVAQAFIDLEDLGILEHILPEILAMKGVAQPVKYHKEGDVWEHTFRALSSLPPKAPLELRWAVLLHDAGKVETFSIEEDRIHFDHHAEKSEEITYNILSRLQFSKQFQKDVAWIVSHHMMMVSLIEMTDRRKHHWHKHPQFKNLLRMFRADIMGSKPRDFSLYKQIKADYKRLKQYYKNKKKYTPILQGRDLIKKFNIPPGPNMGKILTEVEHQHLEEKIHTKAEAYQLVKRLLKQKK